MYPVLANLESIISSQRSRKGGGNIGNITSQAMWDWGWRLHPVTGEINSWHNGIDLPAIDGTEIYAPLDGMVDAAYRSDLSGNLIRITHNDPKYPKLHQTKYAHLNSFAPGIKKGTSVTAGQLIGFVGSTGRSTGPHLHFIITEHQGRNIGGKWRTDIDPLMYLEKKNTVGLLALGLTACVGLYWWFSNH